jgi:hypothetical protein
MSTERYKTGAIIGIETLFQDQNKNPLTTAAGKVTARRLSDDQFAQDAAGASFGSSAVLMNMTKASDAEAPGWQKFDFDTSLLAADSYVFVITDGNSNAVNVPQTAKAIVGDGLAKASEAAAAAAEGKSVYDEGTSILTLYKIDEPTTIEKQFNCKNRSGGPSGDGEIFQKIPI